jgi:DNA-binding NarL/FixJ family response regulator
VPLRCLIVDDSAAFLAASRKILNGRDLSVIGEAATAAEALHLTEELNPDLVLLDIDLGEDSGLALSHELAERAGDAAPTMVLISAHPERDFAELIAESPALGFLTKSELSKAAVLDVLRGHGAGPGGGAQAESR